MPVFMHRWRLPAAAATTATTASALTAASITAAPTAAVTLAAPAATATTPIAASATRLVALASSATPVTLAGPITAATTHRNNPLALSATAQERNYLRALSAALALASTPSHLPPTHPLPRD